MLPLLLTLSACKGSDVTLGDDSATVQPDDTNNVVTDDSATDDSATDDSATDDSGADDTGEGPIDRDGDGSPASEDCDDNNPVVYPGGTEVFDGYDNDCDGVTDANGDYTGTIDVNAVGVYRGQTYRFSLQCPAEMRRTLSDFTLTVTCETDPNDANAQRLLGAQLTMTPDDPYLWEHELWEGRVRFESSDGWDAWGEGTLRWPNMTRANLQVSLDTNYLDMSGSGPMRL